MKKTLVLVFSTFLLSFISVQKKVEKLYAKMEAKQLQKGKYIVLKSEICYNQNGDLVTHFTSPTEYIALTNKVGELKIYDPKKNTVIIKQAGSFSSQTSQFFFFLSGKTSDMGLTNLGFTPSKTFPENSFVVSEWQRKVPDNNSPIQTVKLVHSAQKPIYMEYKDKNKTAIRKVYYYGYNSIGNLFFPTTTTEIIFNSKSDSVITKTVYTDFKTNNEAVSKYFDFKIPTNAIKVNN